MAATYDGFEIMDAVVSRNDAAGSNRIFREHLVFTPFEYNGNKVYAYCVAYPENATADVSSIEFYEDARVHPAPLEIGVNSYCPLGCRSLSESCVEKFEIHPDSGVLEFISYDEAHLMIESYVKMLRDKYPILFKDVGQRLVLDDDLSGGVSNAVSMWKQRKEFAAQKAKDAADYSSFAVKDMRHKLGDFYFIDVSPEDAVQCGIYCSSVGHGSIQYMEHTDGRKEVRVGVDENGGRICSYMPLRDFYGQFSKDQVNQICHHVQEHMEKIIPGFQLNESVLDGFVAIEDRLQGNELVSVDVGDGIGIGE